jgi:hypothetical protein
MTQAKAFSLDDLDATKHGAQAFEFPYLNADGEETGIFLSVLGSESEAVQKEVAALINDRRRKQAAREAVQRIGTAKKQVEYDTLESDVEFGQRLAAVRLVGWRGISDPFTPENALRLCRSNRDIAAQITQASDAAGNFIKL